MCVCNTQYITIINTYICQSAIIQYQHVSLWLLFGIFVQKLFETNSILGTMYSIKSKYPVLHFGGTEFWFLCHLGSRASAVLKKIWANYYQLLWEQKFPKAFIVIWEYWLLSVCTLYCYYVMFHRISMLA